MEITEKTTKEVTQEFMPIGPLVTKVVDVTIELTVKAADLYASSGTKSEIDNNCRLYDGKNNNGGYNDSKNNYLTNVYDFGKVKWVSKLNNYNGEDDGYSIDIMSILINADPNPLILNTNSVTRSRNPKLSANVIENSGDNEYAIYFSIIPARGMPKIYKLDPILKANPKK